MEKKTLLLGILLLTMLLSKYVYACLGLLVFMIPKDKFNSRKDYWKSFVIALLPLTIIGGYVIFQLSSGISGLQAGAGDGADTMTQMQYLKTYPIAAVKVIISTLIVNLNDYLQQLNILGSMNYPLTLLAVIEPCFLLGVGLLDGQEVRDRIKIKHRIFDSVGICNNFCSNYDRTLYRGWYCQSGRLFSNQWHSGKIFYSDADIAILGTKEVTM